MKNAIRTHLKQLADEVDALPEAESRRLRETLDQLQRELDGEAAGTEPGSLRGLVGTVRRAIEEFEVEHPRATAILNEILVKLDSMGI